MLTSCVPSDTSLSSGCISRCILPSVFSILNLDTSVRPRLSCMLISFLFTPFFSFIISLTLLYSSCLPCTISFALFFCKFFRQRKAPTSFKIAEQFSLIRLPNLVSTSALLKSVIARKSSIYIYSPGFIPHRLNSIYHVVDINNSRYSTRIVS